MFSIEENLFDFAFCPMPAFAYLNELAAPEDWGENDRVLKNYLTFTFKRAVHLYNKAVEAGGRLLCPGLSTQLLPDGYRSVYGAIRAHLRAL